MENKMNFLIGGPEASDKSAGFLSEDRSGILTEAFSDGPSRIEAGDAFQRPSGREMMLFRHDLATSMNPLSEPIVPAIIRGTTTCRKPLTILLVEDDQVDAAAIKRAFWRREIPVPIVVAKHGIQALDMLRGDHGYEKILTPCIVLLDLNMPRMGGIRLLKELRGDPALRQTLVFVMTTSAAPGDLRLAYDNNVAGFILKDRPGQSLSDVTAMLESYWQTIEFPG
jgi:CheY-like chemotaxis protein